MNIVVIGGSGGIGMGLVKTMLKNNQICTVHATYRKICPEFNDDRLNWYQLDVTKEEDFKRLSVDLKKIDWIINCVGMLHTKEKGPEKAVRAIEPDFFLDNFKINTLPTLLIAKYFSKLLLGSKAPIFAVVSAKVGSIQDNRLGGWYSYRASKAALNMAIKTISLEWQYKVPNCCVAALHPGTTDTGLSKPFQANVATKKLFSTDQTATLLLDVMGKLNSKNSGRFWNWNGEELPW